MKHVLFPSLFVILSALPARAQSPAPAPSVELRFKPAANNLQIVEWIEDAKGHVIATPYITRVTGQFGLGNRPGSALLKTDFRWPYSRREMVFPVWAHRRDHHYPLIVMGGACGNSPQSMCMGRACGGDCDDTTIAYHSLVSSEEPFYCSPSGSPDAVSCASKFIGSKGAYMGGGAFSLYPPRADLTKYNPNYDSNDINDYAKENDLVAVSAATPPSGQLVSAFWNPDQLAEGDYTAYVELSQESDWSPGHGKDNPDHANQHDSVSAWDFEGHNFLGQPSVVYAAPFHYAAGSATTAIATQLAGYGSWDGSNGTLNPPDASIVTNKPGSGAGRLADVDDGTDVYRLKVVVGTCAGDGGAGCGCAAPDAISNLKLDPGQTSIAVSFTAPSGGAPANRFAVRYREGTQTITEADFDQAVAAASIAAGAPSATLTGTIDGLQRQTQYTVAVRSIAPCGRGGAVVSLGVQTQVPKFVTLSGCFIATAAWGTQMERHVSALREFRDARLLTNPAGQLLTALYYALSPPLARAISTDEHLRALARFALKPIVSAVAR